VLPDDINSVNPGDEVAVQLLDSSLDLTSAPGYPGKAAIG
jgi:hypothetical protein